MIREGQAESSLNPDRYSETWTQSPGLQRDTWAKEGLVIEATHPLSPPYRQTLWGIQL